MIIQMEAKAGEKQLERLIERLEIDGFPREMLDISRGDTFILVGLKGDTRAIDEGAYRALDYVLDVIRISDPCKELTRDFHPRPSIIRLGSGLRVGKDLAIIAGPCAIESRDQLMKTAKLVVDAGANILRGGAFKPRTIHRSFQGLREDGLKLLAEAREKFGIPVITEIMDARDIHLFVKYDIDIWQVGARNCLNYTLLDALAELKNPKPIVLKRGDHVSIGEFLGAALRLYDGNTKVILCERGDKTVDPVYRNVLNLNNVAWLKKRYHLPVLVDPSHGTGVRQIVPDMALAGVAAGADGLMVEVHHKPEEALCDGAQSLSADFKKLTPLVRQIFDLRRQAKMI